MHLPALAGPAQGLHALAQPGHSVGGSAARTREQVRLHPSVQQRARVAQVGHCEQPANLQGGRRARHEEAGVGREAGGGREQGGGRVRAASNQSRRRRAACVRSQRPCVLVPSRTNQQAARRRRVTIAGLRRCTSSPQAPTGPLDHPVPACHPRGPHPAGSARAGTTPRLVAPAGPGACLGKPVPTTASAPRPGPPSRGLAAGPPPAGPGWRCTQPGCP